MLGGRRTHLISDGDARSDLQLHPRDQAAPRSIRLADWRAYHRLEIPASRRKYFRLAIRPYANWHHRPLQVHQLQPGGGARAVTCRRHGLHADADWIRTGTPDAGTRDISADVQSVDRYRRGRERNDQHRGVFDARAWNAGYIRELRSRHRPQLKHAVFRLLR